MAVQAAEKDGIVSILDLQGKRARVKCVGVYFFAHGPVGYIRTVMSIIRRLL